MTKLRTTVKVTLILEYSDGESKSISVAPGTLEKMFNIVREATFKLWQKERDQLPRSDREAMNRAEELYWLVAPNPIPEPDLRYMKE